MKFSIVRSSFLDVLQKVQNVVSAKTSLAILQNALVEAKAGQLSVLTTDLDLSEKCSVPCDVEVEGTTTLPIKCLVSVVRELSEENIFVDVGDDDRATIQCGSSFFRIAGLPMRDFPPIPENSATGCYSLNQAAFREMLRKTNYANAQGDNRQVLNGILLSFKDGKLTVVATDGRRMALVEHEVEFPEEMEADLILPSRTVAELLRILGDEGTVKIYADMNTKQVLFDLGSSQLSTKLLVGKYPNYRLIIPTNCEERIVVDREKLLSAIRRVSIITTGSSNAISLTFSSNQLTISSSSIDVGEARDIVPVKYAGQEFTIFFDPNFVMEPLRVMDDDEIFFEMNGSNNPALLKCGIPFLYLLMPLKH